MIWEPTTMGTALRAAAARAGNQTFIVEADGQERRYSFQEFDAMVDDLARGLLGLGLKRGDLLALWVTNTPEWVLVWLAAARIGVALAPINTRYKTDEAAYIIRQSEAKALIAMDRFWDIDYLAMIDEMQPSLPELETIVIWGETAPPGKMALEALMVAGAKSSIDLAAAEAAVTTDDPLIIVYTSGTTGQPKGAVHSHVTLRNAQNLCRAMHIEPGDVVLGHMPFYHVAGAIAGLQPALLQAGTLVTMAEWNPGHALAVIARERVNILGGIPTHFIDLIDQKRVDPVDTTCLKSAWIGGADVSPTVASAAYDVLGLDALMAVYGMTETTACTTLARFEDPLEITCDNRGLPIGDYEVQVVDVETRMPLPPGQDGEVCVRGHIVMLGYYRDADATAAAIDADGWFKTGDLGRFDADGYLKITGRAKEMFIVGGSNAYPAEIERVLQAHVAVKQAVVVGAPHPRLGEVCYAYVQLEDGEAEDDGAITAWCKTRLADYKVPRTIEFLDDFPRTTTGKIQRFILADKVRLAAEQQA